MSSGGKTSDATLTVVVADANDLRVQNISSRRDALDELPTVGGTTVVFEGTGIGRVDARLPTVVSASYANDDGHEHHAVDCAVEPGRAGEAVRCNTVAGTGGGYVWTLRVDGYAAVLDGDDLPRMRYEAASIRAIRGAGANVHSGSTQGGDTVCVGARRVPRLKDIVPKNECCVRTR